MDMDVFIEAHVHEFIVTGPAIRAHDARRIDPATDHRSQRGLGAIRDDLGVNLALPLEDAKDRLFERASPTPTRRRAASHPAGAEITFIDLDRAANLPALVHSLLGDE